MISQEKWMILTLLQKLPNNVGDLGKIIIATSFEWLPKMHKIAQSGHTYMSDCWVDPFVHLVLLKNYKHQNILLRYLYTTCGAPE